MMSAVGDAVLTLPVMSALRRAFPRAHLAWVLQPAPHALVGPHAAVDEFILHNRGPGSLRGPRFLPGTRSILRTARALQESANRMPEGRFDLLLDLQVYFKAGLLTALAPARRKIGFDRRRTRDLNWVFTNERIPPHPSAFAHIQDQYLEFLHHLGVDPKPLHYGLDLSDEERHSQGLFFRELDGPCAALVGASSDGRKNWTPDGYAVVASRLASDFGMRSLLVGGTSPAENRMAAAILSRTNGKVLDARGGGLRRLLWILDGADLVVTPDSGPLHMARAVGTPVVSLFGFTNPKRSGPYDRFTDLVVDGYARFEGEDYPLNMERRRGGMARITPEMVMEKVARARRNPSY